MKAICRAELDDKGRPLAYLGVEYYLTLFEQDVVLKALKHYTGKARLDYAEREEAFRLIEDIRNAELKAQE